MTIPQDRLYDKEPHNKLYDSVRWRKIRDIVLNSEPLCRLCLKSGKETPSSIADHIEPHKNDPKLFYDRENLQGLCGSCHSGVKRVAELHGYSQACDASGNPTDPKHPWNLKK